MAINHETSMPIGEAAFLNVNFSLEVAALSMEAESANDRQKYYVSIYQGLPAGLQTAVRQLVQQAHPGKTSRDISQRGLAIEQGLVIGTRFAKHTMREDDYARYCKRLEADLLFHTINDPKGSTSLADFMRLGGLGPARQLLPHLPLSLRIFPPNNSPYTMRNNSMYGDAVGYAAAVAKNMLFELAIKSCQPADTDGREEIREYIGHLAAIPEAAIPNYFSVSE